MKQILTFAAISLLASTTAGLACPWAGGTYSGKEGSFRTEFSINDDCTLLTFESSGSAGFQPVDTPETFPLTESKHGWETEIHGVTATFLTKGKNVNFVGAGVNHRIHVEH